MDYIEHHGMRLSDLNFKRYYYGPYSPDIWNIEDLDDNIVVEEKKSGGYVAKESRLVSPENISAIEPDKERALISYIEKYKDKTGTGLEDIADQTEPLLETKEHDETIDLDGYAKYHALINDDKFLEIVLKRDKENMESG
ncbi:MAG: DUF4065 domain-containing protein, partial [Candidatus Parvarchaeum sp.]